MSEAIGVGVGVGYSGRLGDRDYLSHLLVSDGLTVADYDASLGVTGALNASAWANQIGAAGPLLQVAGLNQPIVLPYAGEKYAYLPGVNGNRFTSPDKAVSTGDLALVVKAAADDWTPATLKMFISKDTSGANRDWGFYLDSNGVKPLTFYWFQADGASKAASSTAAPTVVDGADLSVAITFDVDDGAGNHVVKFWQSSDDWVTKTQIGTTITAAGVTNIRRTTSQLYVGDYGSNAPFAGKIYRARAYEGIPAFVGGAGGETLKVDFNAADWSETSTNAATATSSTTGEVWTLNNTGAKLAQVVASAQMLFNGTAGYMQAAFTLNQPITYYYVMKQITWTENDRISDGNTDSSVIIRQEGTTPGLGLRAGTPTGGNIIAPVLNTLNIVISGVSGANSFMALNGGARVATSPGTNNAGGLCFGAGPTGNSPANFQAKRVIIRSALDSAATQAQIQALLKSIYGTP